MIASQASQSRIIYRILLIAIPFFAIELLVRPLFRYPLAGTVFDMTHQFSRIVLELAAPLLAALALLMIERLCRIRELDSAQQLAIMAALAASALAGYLSTDPLAVWAFVALVAMGVAALARFALEFEEVSGLGAGLAVLGLCLLVPPAILVVGAWAVALGVLVTKSRGIAATVSFELVLSFPLLAFGLSLLGMAIDNHGMSAAHLVIGKLLAATARFHSYGVGPAGLASVALAIAVAWIPTRASSYLRSGYVATVLVLGTAFVGLNISKVALVASTVSGAIIAFLLVPRRFAWILIAVLSLQLLLLVYVALPA